MNLLSFPAQSHIVPSELFASTTPIPPFPPTAPVTLAPSALANWTTSALTPGRPQLCDRVFGNPDPCAAARAIRPQQVTSVRPTAKLRACRSIGADTTPL